MLVSSWPCTSKNAKHRKTTCGFWKWDAAHAAVQVKWHSASLNTYVSCAVTFGSYRAAFVSWIVAFVSCRAAFVSYRAAFVSCRAAFASRRIAFVSCTASFA